MSKVVTGVVRLAFANLFSPKASKENPDKLLYGACLIIPKKDKKTVADIVKAMETAIAESGIKGLKLPPIGHPKCKIHDGDLEKPDREEFADSYYINVNTKKQPGLLNLNGQRIIDPEELYSGCYVRASLNAYTFNPDATIKGVTVGLSNIMKVEDGERLGGGASAEEDFAGFITPDYDNPDGVPY